MNNEGCVAVNCKGCNHEFFIYASHKKGWKFCPDCNRKPPVTTKEKEPTPDAKVSG